MVLLHGYPDTLQIWSRLAPRLAKHFQVIAFDWPGMGQSEPWIGGATPFHQAERLATLLTDWQIEEAVLVGIDMGGQPAFAFAAQHADRARAIVVINSLVQWNEQTSWEIALLRKFGWNRIMLRHFPRVVFARALRTFLPAGASFDSPVRTDMWESFRRREVREFIIRMCAGYQGTLPHLAKLYPTIQSPTLLLWAEHDKHFPPGQARRLQAVLPHARLEIISGAEYWMVFFAPEQVAPLHH
jgi:pimeloyl-ACP methyl ester carboxylesterase